MLQSISDVQAAIPSGRPLLLAGSEPALRQLPRGNWIAGTIPYFMGADGGVCTETHVFVTELPADATSHSIAVYSVDTLPQICEDAPANGFSVLIVPSGSAVHAAYAENAPGYENMYLRPVIGWVAGVHLSQIGAAHATVFDGRSASPLTDAAIVMHVALPENKLADVSIINVFRAGNVIVRGNRIARAAFSAVRGNAASNIQIVGNGCSALGEVAIYSEFGFEGAVIANNTIDGAALGISVTNFNEGGRLAVVQGNLVRNLKPKRPAGTDPNDGAGIGISVEADASVTGNVVEHAPTAGIMVGWGQYMRDVSVTGNVVALERIDLHTSGSIEGDVSAPRFVMAEGATVCGKVVAG